MFIDARNKQSRTWDSQIMTTEKTGTRHASFKSWPINDRTSVKSSLIPHRAPDMYIPFSNCRITDITLTSVKNNSIFKHLFHKCSGFSLRTTLPMFYHRHLVLQMSCIKLSHPAFNWKMISSPHFPHICNIVMCVVWTIIIEFCPLFYQNVCVNYIYTYQLIRRRQNLDNCFTSLA